MEKFKSHLAYEIDYKNWVVRNSDGKKFYAVKNIPIWEAYWEHKDKYTRISEEGVEFFFASAKDYSKFDGIIDSLRELQWRSYNEENLHWLQIWYSLDYDWFRSEKWHCKLFTVEIDFFEENVDKARELMPYCEFDLKAFKRQWKQRFNTWEYVRNE